MLAGLVGRRPLPDASGVSLEAGAVQPVPRHVLPGSAIEALYDDARDQLGEAASIAGRVHNLAIQSLSQLIDIPNDPGVTPIVVFNPLAWPVRTMVELEYGGLKPTDGLLDERRPARAVPAGPVVCDRLVVA